ncbi:hypothetical protein [Methylobacterium sp. GC_Met_2]|uniref:hypothetical protein n=1 Tax=Methylobacterium sp. GC_Met_2 TaxID=2937376 RepID=UPI00226BB542|nr:hypothetical protein [Methylobacterium sp. GC_Met_2]
MGYVITSARETGTITYYCPSTRSALEKLHDFQRADYRDITVTFGERVISEGQLSALEARDTAASLGT